jgi:hypothetical protein
VAMLPRFFIFGEHGAHAPRRVSIVFCFPTHRRVCLMAPFLILLVARFVGIGSLRLRVSGFVFIIRYCLLYCLLGLHLVVIVLVV